MESNKQQVEKELGMIISDVSCTNALSLNVPLKVKMAATLMTLTAGQYVISAVFILSIESITKVYFIPLLFSLLAAVLLVKRMGRYVEVYFMISDEVRASSLFVSQVKKKMLDFICSYLLLSTVLVTVALFVPSICFFFPVVIVGACVMLEKIIGNELAKYNVGISVARFFSVYRHGTPSVQNSKN